MYHWTIGLNSDKTSKVFFVLMFAVFYQISFFLYRSGLYVRPPDANNCYMFNAQFAR